MDINHQLNENIKPAINFMIVGALIILGMRLMEMAWPRKPIKAQLLICITESEELSGNCRQFEDFIESKDSNDEFTGA